MASKIKYGGRQEERIKKNKLIGNKSIPNPKNTQPKMQKNTAV